MQLHYALDTETLPICDEHPYPPLVCLQLTGQEGDRLYSYRLQKKELYDLLVVLLTNDNIVIHITNSQFDSIVLCLAYPELEPLFWEKHDKGLIWDATISERLSNLASFGSIEFMPLQEGVNKEIGYSQADLEMDYLGVDRTEEKKGGVRTSFELWADVPVNQWPAEYVQYALNDTRYLYQIVALQWKRFTERGTAESVAKLIGFRSAAAFALGWATYNGMRTNPAAIVKLDTTVKYERDLSRYPALIREIDGVQVGIITAGQPERDDARGSKNHVEGCPRKNCGCPVKRVAAKKHSLSRSRLAQIILHTARWAKENHAAEISLFLTDGGIAGVEAIKEKRHIKLECDDPLLLEHPDWVSTDESNYSQVTAYSEELRQYAKREEWGQIEKQYVGRLFWDRGNNCSRSVLDKQLARAVPDSWFEQARVNVQPVEKVRFIFEPIVKSGRTGSRADKLYPSMNGQNVDPRVRGCMIHRPGHLTISQDIMGLELISAAWRCESLGIKSVLAALIKAGEDAHSYLTASMVQRMTKREEIPAEFQHACDEFSMRRLDRFGLYKAFMPLKKSKDEKVAAFVKKWRGLGKVAGLGGWGALGKNVLHQQASSFGIDVTVQECADALEIWRETLPETGPYSKHVQTNMVDLPFSKEDKETGKLNAKYKLTSPLGMVVRNLNWNEVNNMNALQTPSAEAMLKAVFLISRACRDWTRGSVLYGCYFLDFIHDEVLLDIPIFEDYNQTVARFEESARLLKEGISSIFQGFPIGVETVAMYTWDKNAKEAKDDQGRLVPKDLPVTLQVA
jgi:hypothetical protein